MRQFIKGWWHVTSAVLAGLWLVGSAVFGWVNDVEAFMTIGLTTKKADVTYVRKDVQSEQLRRIESELKALNDQFRLFLEKQNE